MDSSLGAAIGLGFLLGVRHAADADHIAAVSTFVSQDRRLLRSCLVGVWWGAGHTMALMTVSVFVIVFKVSIPPALEQLLETAVGILLVLLGGHVLLRTAGVVSLHRHAHTHDEGHHTHLHVHVGSQESHAHGHLVRMAGRPFLVGVLHGLAGSAALAMLVLATVPTPAGGVFYILAFGLGSTAGMLLLSGLLGVPFAMTAGRWRTGHSVIQALAGVASLVVGLALVLRLGH